MIATLTSVFGRALAPAVTAGLVLMLAGCSVGGMLGGGENPSAQLANTSASPAQVAAAAPGALPAIATECPPIRVRPGGEAMFSYGSGRLGAATDLRYQAVIDQQTRNCVVSNGLITVKMGVAGRVLLGPKGTESAVDVPLRFAVERDGVAVFSEKYVIPVSLAGAQSGDFVKVLENVAIPYVGGEQIVIWVGFDPR